MGSAPEELGGRKPRPARATITARPTPAREAPSRSGTERAVPDRASERPSPERTTAARPPRPARPTTPVPQERYYRQTITKVDLWSVLKMSVGFYLCGVAVTFVALATLYVTADSAGVISSVEQFFDDILDTQGDFSFLSGEVLRGALLVAAVVVVLQIVITVIAASFYNLFAELFGGIEITIKEEESDY